MIETIDYLDKKSNNKLKLVYEDWRLADHKLYISDITKLKSRDWKPKTSIWEGIDRVYKHIKDNFDFYVD